MLGKVVYHENKRLMLEFEEEINPEFLEITCSRKREPSGCQIDR